MRALRDMNLPKFVFEDVPLFLGLISDLFPGLDCPRVRYPDFNGAVEDILQENKYILLPHQVTFVCFLKIFVPDSHEVFYFNPFHVIGLFLYPLKTSENQKFSDVFRGYTNRPVA